MVAEEVRKLAEESNQAAQEVGQIMEELRSRQRNAGEEVQASRDQVDKAVALAKNTYEELHHSLKVVERMNGVVQNIAAIAQEQAASSEEMAASVDSITQNNRRVKDALGLWGNPPIPPSTPLKEWRGAASELARGAEIFSGSSDSSNSPWREFPRLPGYPRNCRKAERVRSEAL